MRNVSLGGKRMSKRHGVHVWCVCLSDLGHSASPISGCIVFAGCHCSFNNPSFPPRGVSLSAPPPPPPSRHLQTTTSLRSSLTYAARGGGRGRLRRRLGGEGAGVDGKSRSSSSSDPRCGSALSQRLRARGVVARHVMYRRTRFQLLLLCGMIPGGDGDERTEEGQLRWDSQTDRV